MWLLLFTPWLSQSVSTYLLSTYYMHLGTKQWDMQTREVRALPWSTYYFPGGQVATGNSKKYTRHEHVTVGKAAPEYVVWEDLSEGRDHQPSAETRRQ